MMILDRSMRRLVELDFANVFISAFSIILMCHLRAVMRRTVQLLVSRKKKKSERIFESIRMKLFGKNIENIDTIEEILFRTLSQIETLNCKR